MSTRSIAIAIIVALMVALHFTLRPILDWRAGIDFLTIAVLVVAVLAMTVVGFAASRLKAAFFSDNVMLNAVFVFVGKVAYDLIFLVAERRLGGGALAVQLLLWTPLAALLTALVGLLVMSVVRPTLERRRP